MSMAYMRVGTLAVRTLDANEDSGPGGDVLAVLDGAVSFVVGLESDAGQAFLHDSVNAVDDAVSGHSAAAVGDRGQIHLQAHLG